MYLVWVGWTTIYHTLWSNPIINYNTVSHSVVDPHLSNTYISNPSYTAISAYLAVIGIHTISDTYLLVIGGLIINIAYTTYFTITKSNITISIVELSILSICWSGHLVHVPISNYERPILDKSLTTQLTLDPVKGLIPITDIAHHHLALGILGIVLSSMYSRITNIVGINIKKELLSSTSILVVSLMSELFSVSSLTNPVSKPSSNIVTSMSVNYTHHIWISLTIIVIYLIISARSLSKTYTSPVVMQIYKHKSLIQSSLSYITLILGFHTLLLYVHNDSVLCIGSNSKQLQISSNLIPDIIYKSSWSSITLNPISSEYLSSHAVSLAGHVSLLVAIKGILDSSSTRLFPDKYNYGLSYSCDGPGRGGTCDISTVDSLYLSGFWILNTGSWSTIAQNWLDLSRNSSNIQTYLDQSKTINGYFKDYLWYNSGVLVKGYDFTSTTDISVYNWMFLIAHLIWAVGYMYLISWRGYWQELIDSVQYIHVATPLVSSITVSRSQTPTALTIVQARLVGLSHYSVGLILTYAPFLVGSTQ